MAEIVNQNGEPRYFVAPVDGVEEAFAEVPDEVVLDAFRREWLTRGLAPPEIALGELRERSLVAYAARAELTPVAILKSLSESAQALGVSERSLRHRIDAGELETTAMRDGTTALEFVAPPQRWHLCPGSLRPDPRGVMQMREQSIQPGEAFEWRVLGDERSQTYTRRADGKNWPASW